MRQANIVDQPTADDVCPFIPGDGPDLPFHEKHREIAIIRAAVNDGIAIAKGDPKGPLSLLVFFKKTYFLKRLVFAASDAWP